VANGTMGARLTIKQKEDMKVYLNVFLMFICDVIWGYVWVCVGRWFYDLVAFEDWYDSFIEVTLIGFSFNEDSIYHSWWSWDVGIFMFLW